MPRSHKTADSAESLALLKTILERYFRRGQAATWLSGRGTSR
jgi:hypothetical protein